MNSTIKRLLTFFVGIPIVLGIVFFDYCNNLLLQIVIGLFAVMGANEFYNMISPTKKLFSKATILILTAMLPYLAYLFILFDLSLEIAPWFYIIEVIFLMFIESFTSKNFDNSLSKIAYSSLIIFYCGFLITFISRMAYIPNSTYIISFFLILVFLCDSGAWFFGVLFGKSTRGIFAASPNKSLVGFIGGILTSIASGLLFRFLFPEQIYISIPSTLLIGLLTSIAAITGDLIESVFKRSCKVKDSGKLIPGRGGILDSIDSILIAAPIFYISYHFIF